MWECALNRFTMELVHECLFDSCHLRGLGVIHYNCGFFVDPYAQMVPNRCKNLHDT